MAFSFSAIWDDTTSLMREHGKLLAAIAGVFIFLPALLFAKLQPPPEMTDPARVWEMLGDYYGRVWPWLLVESLVSMVGTAAMLRLVFARSTSVGGALTYGLMLLPFYFLLSVLISLIVAGGLILLIVPGLYLVGRVVPAAPVMIAENRRNPIDAVSRSFAITKGHGWAVFGLVFIVAVVGGIVLGVATMIFGLIAMLAAGPEAGRLLVLIFSSACNALLVVLILMLYAAIYRALTGDTSVAQAFE